MSFCSAFEQKADHSLVLYLVFFPFDLHPSPLVQLCHFPVSLQVFISDFGKKTTQKISPSVAQILLKNGNFAENALYSSLKTDCRRRLQTPMESGSGEPSHRNGYLMSAHSTASNSIFPTESLPVLSKPRFDSVILKIRSWVRIKCETFKIAAENRMGA